MTTRISFFTSIYVAAMRNPFVVAKAVGTAAALSGGRVALGVVFLESEVMYGLKGEVSDEAVAAAIVLKDGARASTQELQELVKGRLRSSRVPQKIVFKDVLPYNETGKVLRRVIRQEFA